ncbi:Na+/H+ antiporter [Pseudonocardiaceae bacterium YIM PH 21723]|nr:Na+/H+ antiporter [Pseudonocardiaceae bacterium YIM PH 21723]
MRSVETVLFLVVLATIVATFARRLKVPAPSLLVVAGVIIGLLPGVPQIQITPEMVSLIVLPPLLFAAGEELPWRDLRSVWRPVSALAVGLVLATAFAVAFVAVWLTALPWSMALILGTVLASTDPVAVTALGRRLALPSRVQTLVQAESLFNDATSLLVFRVAVTIAVAGGAVSFEHTATEFVILAGGGTLIGFLVAGGVILIRRRTEDPVLESIISLVTPYAAYVLAESFEGSGVTAVVVASVVIGTQTNRLTNAHIRLQLTAVYETVIFILESVVFGLIGLELPTLIKNMSGEDVNWPLQALAIVATLVLIRVLWVFPLSAVLQRRRGIARPTWHVPAVISWAGARGVVPLAAALSIPLVTDAGAALPHRDLVVLLTTAVIVASLVIQGFTLEPLVRRAGIAASPDDVRGKDLRARMLIAKAGLDHLELISEAEAAPDYLVAQLRNSWQRRIERLEDGPVHEENTSYQQLRRDLIAVEVLELTRLYETGTIDEGTRRRVQRQLDLEDAGLGDEH